MKLMSANYTPGAINAGLLILRVGMGVLCAAHGYDKVVNFAAYEAQFINFLGIGQAASVGLSLFAEFFCALLVIFGLFTRLACVPLVINFLVAVFMAHGADIIFYSSEARKGTAEHPMLYAIAFFALFITGPGKYSADGAFRR